MSHGQTGHLAINANAAIINTKVLNCGGGELGGNTIAVGASSVSNSNSSGKVAIKINQKSNNNELRYATVTIAPPVNTISQSGIKIANSGVPGMQHGVSSSGGGNLIHLIPLHIANVSNVATTTTISNSKSQQLKNDMPLKIITKNTKLNAEHNSLIRKVEETNDIAKIIGTTLPIKEGFTDPVTMSGLNVSSGIGVSRGLMPNVNTTNISTGLNGVPSSNTAALNGSPTILIHNQIPKAAATLQCVPIASGGVASIISANNEIKIGSQFALNGNIPKSVEQLAETVLPYSPITTNISEETNVMESQPGLMEATSNHHMFTAISAINNEFNNLHTSLPSSTSDKFSNSNLISYDRTPISSNVSITATIVPTAVTSAFNSTTTMITETKSLSDIVSECILPDNVLHTEEELLQTEVITSNFSDVNCIPEEVDRSETMLIIDDSTDDEYHDAQIGDIKKSENIHSNPMNLTHISNSVVLTKANVADIKSSGGLRNLASEPASVVLMKLPNATQQVTGTTNPNVEIPIIEAFTLASNAENCKTNFIKIVPPPKLIASSPKIQSSTIYMRSNSVPSPTKSLSPRSAKRCQSLNCGQPVKLNSVQQQMNTSNLVSPEKHRYSNPVKSLITYQKNCTASKELVTNQKDLPLSDEPNKENNDISFIELDDSLTEDVLKESDLSDSIIIAHDQKELKTSLEEKLKDTDKEKLTQEESINLDFNKEKSLNEKTLNDESITKDENTKVLPSITNVQTTSTEQKLNKTHLNPIEMTRINLEKKENNDQTIKSLLCNENIPVVTASSSSTSSTQDTSPVLIQSTARQALTPRVRDHNRIIDANASTARRLCRDSSIASALSMVSTFDMLNWKEDRIASARGTNMRFELNEFNLLQVHERGCPPRYRIHTPYERPIYERFRSMPKSDQADPLLYLCRTCKLYGPAVDFLAPEFCSVECLKRILGKRSSRDIDGLDSIDKKRSRKSAPISSTNKSFSNSTMHKQPPVFRWSSYLANMRNTIAAPIDLFLNPFPTGPNPFLVGMKIEAIDPENCSLFCVCTIVQIQGYRLRLNFDGYNNVYDFWVNADSMDIFPPGWCAKTNRILQPPRGVESHKFDWSAYLKRTNSIGADKKFFTHLNSASITNRNPFTVGMFLEADDLNDTGKLCVASVADVLDERIRVHFDGWDDCYDYWVDTSSPYIHPCGWHEGRQQLLVPPEYSNASFNWRDYIRESQGLAAPTDFFVPRDPIDYRPGMKLEVVDPRNPCLIRPATVIHRTRHRVKIHFDCWPPEYIFCLEDDSPDLHPIGWCDATGHELEPPPGFQQPPKVMPCSSIGCRGLGNMDRSNGLTHATREFCPYVLENWRSKSEKIPRVDGKEIVRKIRHDSSTISILKNIKRPYNQNSNSIELLKATEKLLNIPYKQPTRGRPRNCDRLAAAQRAQLLLQQQQQQNRQNVSEIIKSEIEQENLKKQAPKEASLLNSRKSQSTSTSTSPTPTSTADAKITVVKRFLCDYGPRLEQNYLLWRQNAGVDIASKVQRNPLLWSTAESCAFIDAVLSECHGDTARYAVSSKFYKHDIDGPALLMLQQQDLTEILQFKLGPAIKICEIILQLRMIVVSNYGSSITNIEAEDKQQKDSKVSDHPK